MRGLLPILLVACGSGADHPDASPEVDAFPTAAHEAYPQVPNLGGPILAHPQVVTITFANDPIAPSAEAYAQWIVGSQWLDAVGAEYGVGAGAVAGVAHRPETPPVSVTSDDIANLLAAGLADYSIPKPADAANALYVFYYPSSTAITATFVHGIVKHSCSQFGGFHTDAHLDGMDLAFAVIPNCGGSTTLIPDMQTVVSHELIEAATDPLSTHAPAYALAENADDAWFSAFEFEVEVGDLCEAPSRDTLEAGHTAQRLWSNAAAAAGKDPCVPADPSAPVFGATVPSMTLKLAPGASTDLTVSGWSTSAVPDWNIAVQPFDIPMSQSQRPRIQLDQTKLNNGQTTTMHVSVPATVVSGTHAGYMIVSQLSGTTSVASFPLSIDVP